MSRITDGLPHKQECSDDPVLVIMKLDFVLVNSDEKHYFLVDFRI
jgi:hypothetical protein